MPLSKGTMGLYKTHHCKCNIITYLIKYILLSIHGLFILFTLGFLVRNKFSLFRDMTLTHNYTLKINLLSHNPGTPVRESIPNPLL